MENLWVLLSACENPGVLKVLSFVLKLMDVVFFIVPMGLIVMISIDFFKNVIASKEDEYKRNLNLVIKRLLYTVALFLLPTMVEFMLGLVSDVRNNIKGDYQSCIDNIAYIKTYESRYEDWKQKEEEEWKEYLKQQNADEKFKSDAPAYTVSSSSSEGTHVGSRYRLSDEEINVLAAMCAREQGSDIAGMQAEASLMANRYELYGSGYSSVYDYVLNSGWFGSSSASSSSLTTEQIEAVSSVFSLGRRTLPLYVDEHDCWKCNTKNYCSDGKQGDICSISGGSSLDVIQNRDNYQKGETVINNVYGATYTFYAFPTSDSDPFGYTEEAKNKFNSNENRR